MSSVVAAAGGVLVPQRAMLPLALRVTAARLLDPALVLLVVFGVGLWLSRRGSAGAPATEPRVKWGRRLILGAWIALWLLSTPVVATSLVNAIELRGPDLRLALADADPARTALVVLAGGLRGYIPDVPPRERLDGSSQARVIGAARLYHTHGFGLVIVSGAPGVQTEAMADLLAALGVPRERVVREDASANTRDNAVNSARILRERGIERVVVTTSASHLPRALAEFERAGIHAVPAAVDRNGPADLALDSLLPSAGALGRSHVALHEILGRLKP